MPIKDIAIYGAGGFGRELYCMIQDINDRRGEGECQWNVVGFFDDAMEKGSRNEYGVVLGGISELNAWQTPLNVAIAIGSPKSLKKIACNVTNELVSWPNIISPDVTFLDRGNVTMGRGNIICSHCFFSCHAKIGSFNLFNCYASIGHDDTIGDYNVVMPAVRLSGELIIGNGNFFGVSSVVLQKITIGDNTTIGANSVIIRHPKDGCTYLGNPAKRIEY